MVPHSMTQQRTPIKAISRTKSLVERAHEQLETLIIEGSLLPGEILPPERMLGQMLGVSRTVVREAVRLLTARGLLEVRSGSGTYVRALGASVIHDSVDLLLRANRLSPEQIYEVRNVLEINAAGLAAERAGPENITAMEAEIAMLQQETLPAQDYAQHDFLFHVLLAESTGNPLFLALINSVSTITIRAMHQMFAAGIYLRPPSRRLTLEEHSAVLKSIKQHNAEDARVAMADHMKRALDRLRDTRHSSAPDHLVPAPESK